MNEACLNARWLRKDLTNPEAQKFTQDVLNFMRNKLSDYQEQYGDLYNLEATPAESTAYRLAKHDRERYPDIITASDNDEAPYYTNSSHLPVGYTDDIFTALEVQDNLQTLYTSGTVFHTFLGQKLPDWQSCMSLVRKIAENFRLPYYTMSPTYSVCKNHGYITGEVYRCPTCGEVTEVYSRITGYYRPIQNWNVGKLEEFKNRQTYNIATSVLNKAEAVENNIPVDVEAATEQLEGPVLFTTKTCPNCKMAKMLLAKHNVQVNIIDAEEEVELTNKFGVRKAPTLFVPNNNGGYDVYDNVSLIKGWLEGKADA